MIIKALDIAKENAGSGSKASIAIFNRTETAYLKFCRHICMIACNPLFLHYVCVVSTSTQAAMSVSVESVFKLQLIRCILQDCN